MSLSPSSQSSKNRREGHSGGHLCLRHRRGVGWIFPVLDAAAPLRRHRASWILPLLGATADLRSFRFSAETSHVHYLLPLSKCLVNRMCFTHAFPCLAADREAATTRSKAAHARY